MLLQETRGIVPPYYHEVPLIAEHVTGIKWNNIRQSHFVYLLKNEVHFLEIWRSEAGYHIDNVSSYRLP